MRNFIIATTILFNLIAVVGNGQVRKTGPLIVGDSTQTHLLVQMDSTKFLGRCLGISADSVTFEYLGQTRKFSAQSIAYLSVAGSTYEDQRMDTVVLEETLWVKTSNFVYMGKKNKGVAFYGTFVDMRDGCLTLEDKDKQKQYYPLDGIISFWLIGDDISKYEEESLYLNLLVTKGKEKLKGQIIRYDEKSIVFQLLHDSIMTIPLTEIQEIILYEQKAAKSITPYEVIDATMVSKQEYFNNSLFFTPTAFAHEKKTIFYRNILVYFNSFSWYVDSKISINAFASPLGAGLGAKLIFPLGKAANIGVGSNLLKTPIKDSGRLMPFGILTLGNKNSFLSMSYQVLNIKLENEEHPNPRGIFTMGGTVKLAPKLSVFADLLISNSLKEVYFYSRNFLWTGGISFYTEKFRWDFGAAQLKDVFAEDSYKGSDLLIPTVGLIFRNNPVKKKD